MTTKSYYRMIQLHSDKFIDTMNNDKKFVYYSDIYGKTFLTHSIIHDNFDAYLAMIQHSSFKSDMTKPEISRHFLKYIAERVTECEWERNRRYIDALFDINYNFTIDNLMYFKSTYNIFMEILYRMNNIDYTKILERIHILDDDIQIKLLELIIKHYKNNNMVIPTSNIEYCIKQNIQEGNITCLNILLKNGYNISMINTVPTIAYLLSYRLNEHLITYLLSQNWYYNLNFFDYIGKSGYNIIEKLLIIKQNYTRFKIQFETIKDTNNLYFDSIVMNALTNFNGMNYNNYYNPVNLVKIIKCIYFLLDLAKENNVTNMIESISKKFYTKSIEIYNTPTTPTTTQTNYNDKIKYYLKEFMTIMVASKQTQTDDFKNLLTLVFTKNELEQISQVP